MKVTDMKCLLLEPGVEHEPFNVTGWVRTGGGDPAQPINLDAERLSPASGTIPEH